MSFYRVSIMPNNHSLRRRLVLATTVPLLVLTLLLTATTVTERDRGIVNRLQEFGGGIATYLASVSDFALYSSDRQLLNALVTATMGQEGVKGIAFLDAERQAVVSTFTEGFLFPSVEQSGVEYGSPDMAIYTEVDEVWYFQSPVWVTYLDTEDYGAEAGPPAPRLLGWVVVALDPSIAQAERQGVLVSGVGIAAGILTMAIVLSYLLSRNILDPISQLTKTVSAIEGGDYSARAQRGPGYEVDVLAQGINHMAQSIADSRTGLQREVKRATAELQATLSDLREKNRELEIARQSAEDANAAKTDFLARMSHELRTPLNSIHGFVELLQSSDLDDSALQYCRIIDQAAHLLLQLIDDILVFTRLQAQATELEVLPVDIYQCLEDPVQLLAPLAHDKQLDLILDIAPGTPKTLLADSRRLRQIITNLLSNAIKFTEQGYVLVKASLVSEQEDYYRLAIVVKDTGIGIPKQQLKYVFDVFNQADSSISRRFGGAGLGLAIVKALTDLMGGSIVLESTLGVGTEITVDLPLRKDLAGLGEEGVPERQPIRVSIYDPRKNSRDALLHLLDRLVERVDGYADIPSLREGVGTNPPDRILVNPVELSADDVDGLVARLNTIRQFADVPLIVGVTLKQMQQIIGTQREVALRPVHFVSKPPTLEVLRDVLKGSELALPAPELLPQLPGVNVLVAEDNEFSQFLMKTILQRAECDFCLTADGQEAIAASMREKFDVIIVDGHMPGLDGWETLRAIRALTNSNHATPAILLTADVVVEATAPAGVGIRRVMHKPFDEGELLRAIADLSGKGGQQSAPRDTALRGIPKEKFYSQLDQLLATLAKANGEGDIDMLEELSHQLLGIAGVFRLGALGGLAEDLHAAARSASRDRVTSLLVELGREMEQLKRSVG
ncbi:MAG TPA: hypothetical protein DIT58_04720 [Porticoccaceae bacterium]|nr:hypothetical protein [Porticoccaceae bacterium]